MDHTPAVRTLDAKTLVAETLAAKLVTQTLVTQTLVTQAPSRLEGLPGGREATLKALVQLVVGLNRTKRRREVLKLRRRDDDIVRDLRGRESWLRILLLPHLLLRIPL